MNSIKKCLIIFLIQSVSSIPLDSFRDDSLTKTTPEMIADEGYPVETHWVTTPDGYNLCLHRIPTGKNGETNKKVAFLMHGILTTSSDFILFGPGKSLGYILADEGYDVWMGNARGNKYSRNHTRYNPDIDGEFWQFSWHEIGEFDLPTMIDYALSTTGVDGVYYVGHSQGTTSFFVMASEKVEYNKKIKIQASLAPIAYMEHMTSPLLSIVASWEGILENVVKLLGINEFLPSSGFLNMLQNAICKEGVGTILCQNVLFALCGFSIPEMNLTSVPLIMGHTPAGASTKQLIHYGQEINSHKFRKFDYGLIENLQRYNNIFPPDYDMKKITAPVFLFYSKSDWMTGVADVERLYNELGNPAGKLCIAEDTFNHLDFTYGINAPQLVYRYVANLFKRY